jgi:predicted phosphodiesterase
VNVEKIVNAKGKAVLLIGDSHIPYEHRDYLKFCKAVSKKHKCKVHIHVGDEVDNHAISFHDTDPELLAPSAELDKSIVRLQGWHDAFKDMILLNSNHGSLVHRKFKHHGIPLHYLKPLKDIYETPTWTWVEDVLVRTKYGDYYGCHGKSSGYGKLAKEMGCSAFQGHYHGKQEITRHASALMDRFNIFVGCGIDRKSLAFAYGKNHIPKPLLGCAVIDEEGIPHLYHMKLKSNGRWNGKV